jgi:hypothetical protein
MVSGKWRCCSLDELDALEQAHDLEEAQDLDGAQDAHAAARRDLGVARTAFLEGQLVIKKNKLGVSTYQGSNPSQEIQK